MNKTSLLLTLLLLFALSLSAQKQASALRYLIKVQRTINKLEAYEADASLSYYTAHTIDTLHFKGRVRYLKDAHDPFFGYYLWYSNRPFFDAYYSRGKAYLINHQSKKIYPSRFLDPKKIAPNRGPFSPKLTNIFFPPYLRSDTFFEHISHENDLTITRTAKGWCPDTIIISTRHHLPVIQEINDTVWELRSIWYFDRRSKLPLKLVQSGQSSKGPFYSCLTFSNIQLKSDSTEHFFMTYKLPPGYQLIEANEKKTHSHKSRFIPVAAPPFELPTATGERLKLSDLRGKVVLLDFWFTTCRPCLKATPYLESMTHDYADSGLVVIGINPIDSKERIISHFRKWGRPYPTLLCDENTKSRYAVSSFPSFILINRRGLIVYRTSGFSPALMRSIRHETQKALRQP